MGIAINDASRMYVIKNVTYAIYVSSATHSFLVVSIYCIRYKMCKKRKLIEYNLISKRRLWKIFFVFLDTII